MIYKRDRGKGNLWNDATYGLPVILRGILYWLTRFLALNVCLDTVQAMYNFPVYLYTETPGTTWERGGCLAGTAR